MRGSLKGLAADCGEYRQAAAETTDAFIWFTLSAADIRISGRALEITGGWSRSQKQSQNPDKIGSSLSNSQTSGSRQRRAPN